MFNRKQLFTSINYPQWSKWEVCSSSSQFFFYLYFYLPYHHKKSYHSTSEIKLKDTGAQQSYCPCLTRACPFLHWTTSIMMKYRSFPWPWKDWQSCFCSTLSVSYTSQSNNYICYWVFITRAESRNCFNFLTPLQHRLLRHGGRSDLEDEASPFYFHLHEAIENE